jgi:pimeloyl-ACP methyl ester carboxylesterase
LLSHFLSAGDIRLHYLRYPGAGPVLLLLHGLTANAQAFGGLMNAGLGTGYSIVSLDLRGRGLSDHPAFSYGMEEHAADVLALIESLGVERVHICGHSFGAFLGVYLAAEHPEKVEKLIMLDAGVQMNSKAGEMLLPRVMMLEQVSLIGMSISPM